MKQTLIFINLYITNIGKIKVITKFDYYYISMAISFNQSLSTEYYSCDNDIFFLRPCGIKIFDHEQTVNQNHSVLNIWSQIRSFNDWLY